MAKLIAPLHSAEARGRVGGIVYNTWRGVRYCKAKTGPAQPRSQLQLAIRTITIWLARYWQLLEVAERAGWNAYAVEHQEVDWTGSPVRLTGLNWFIRCNSRLKKFLGTSVDTAPIAPAPEPVEGYTLTGGANQIKVDWDDTGLATGYTILWLRGPRSPGAIPTLPKARYKALGVMNAETLTITALVPGTYDVWVVSMDGANGLYSTYQVASAVVTAPA